MKPSENLPASLRREVALDIADQKDQDTEQNGDLQNIIDKKLNAPADPCPGIQTECGKHLPDQNIQPFHAENLILNKLPDHLQPHFPSLQSGCLSQSREAIKS